MDLIIVPIIYLTINNVEGFAFCENKIPLEIGKWRHDLHHMDTATIENRPVAAAEGQLYVYENYFPNSTIKYIHVDNLAKRSCGASATIKAGGVGTSTVLIMLHADPFQEIRSVIDIWGRKGRQSAANRPKLRLLHEATRRQESMKSLYLFKEWRAVHHNYKLP